MKNQRLALLILSALGSASIFLPWLKDSLEGTIVGISGKGNMEGVWLCLALFLIIFFLCLSSKSSSLNKIRFWTTIIFSIITSLLGIFYIVSDWTSLKADTVLGIPGASQLHITIGIAPYLVTIIGILILIISFSLNRKNGA